MGSRCAHACTRRRGYVMNTHTHTQPGSRAALNAPETTHSAKSSTRDITKPILSTLEHATCVHVNDVFNHRKYHVVSVHACVLVVDDDDDDQMAWHFLANARATAQRLYAGNQCIRTQVQCQLTNRTTWRFINQITCAHTYGETVRALAMASI